MRTYQPVLAMIAAAVCLGSIRASCAGFSLFSHSWGDVIVITDMTPEGRELTPPTTEQPAYYLGRSLGGQIRVDSGRPTAG